MGLRALLEFAHGHSSTRLRARHNGADGVAGKELYHSCLPLGYTASDPAGHDLRRAQSTINDFFRISWCFAGPTG